MEPYELPPGTEIDVYFVYRSFEEESDRVGRGYEMITVSERCQANNPLLPVPLRKNQGTMKKGRSISAPCCEDRSRRELTYQCPSVRPLFGSMYSISKCRLSAPFNMIWIR